MDSKTLSTLYRSMLRIRLVELRIAELYPEQEMRCPVHLCVGQEAIAAGVSANLRQIDHAYSGHRSHGHYLAKGGDLRAMMAEIYGKATGCCSGKGGSMHLVDLEAGFVGATPIVGSTIAIGVGDAFAASLRGEDRVTVIYHGEGAIEEGVFHEAVDFAVLRSLPVVFVCENNLFSVYSPMSVRQPVGREVCSVAAGHGIEAAQGDGNNVAEVHEMAGRAIAKARGGQGPSFLEFKTYRWLEHCGPDYDNDIGYREPAEFELWKGRDPLPRTEKALLASGAITSSALDEMAAEVRAEMDDAVAFAKSSPFPDPALLATNVYAGSKEMEAVR